MAKVRHRNNNGLSRELTRLKERPGTIFGSPEALTLAGRLFLDANGGRVPPHIQEQVVDVKLALFRSDQINAYNLYRAIRALIHVDLHCEEALRPYGVVITCQEWAIGNAERAIKYYKNLLLSAAYASLEECNDYHSVLWQIVCEDHRLFGDLPPFRAHVIEVDERRSRTIERVVISQQTSPLGLVYRAAADGNEQAKQVVHHFMLLALLHNQVILPSQYRATVLGAGETVVWNCPDEVAAGFQATVQLIQTPEEKGQIEQLSCLAAGRTQQIIERCSFLWKEISENPRCWVRPECRDAYVVEGMIAAVPGHQRCFWRERSTFPEVEWIGERPWFDKRIRVVRQIRDPQIQLGEVLLRMEGCGVDSGLQMLPFLANLTAYHRIVCGDPGINGSTKIHLKLGERGEIYAETSVRETFRQLRPGGKPSQEATDLALQILKRTPPEGKTFVRAHSRLLRERVGTNGQAKSAHIELTKPLFRIQPELLISQLD